MFRNVMIIVTAMAVCHPASGQNNGQPGQGGQGGQGGQFPGGIVISADGVISSPQAQRINPALEQRRLKAVAAQQLPGENDTTQSAAESVAGAFGNGMSESHRLGDASFAEPAVPGRNHTVTVHFCCS